MAEERWERVKRVVDEALALNGAERARFLDRTCAGDDTLRAEVESLLRYERDSFLEPSEVSEQDLVDRSLGHYRIVEAIGRGGMGRVYRARDGKLDRDVAIKMLPEAVAGDPERLARFEREAKVLASLKHPNIASIHAIELGGAGDIPIPFLVMELIDGENLQERMARGPTPIDQAIPIALQIADALETTHERGIIHRDLKPANVMVDPAGAVKVLDFGLAKPHRAEQLGDDSQSPTATDMTRANVLLGTAAYMSPEQARGAEADVRSDSWSFGVMLWELLTGRSLFRGESTSDTLAAVLRGEIDFDALPAGTPATLRTLVARCLCREPRSRLRHIGEARIALEALASGQEPVSLVNGPVPSSKRQSVSRGVSSLGWIAAALAGTAAVVFGVLYAQQEPELRVIASSLTVPATLGVDYERGIAISPDGSRVTSVVTNPNGLRQLWVQELSALEGRLLAGTEGASDPFWSPDGREIGFFAGARLKRISADGGLAETLAVAPDPRGGSWGRGGRIAYAPYFTGGLKLIDDTGGEPEALTELAPGEMNHRFPHFLPEGKSLLFLALRGETQGGTDEGRIEGLDLATAKRKPLVSTSSSMAYAPPGHLLYWQDGTLVAQGFDASRLSLTSRALPVVGDVRYSNLEYAVFSATSDRLVFERGTRFEPAHRLEVVDRSGRPVGDALPESSYVLFALSHDGRRVAYGHEGAIWILDLIRGTSSRLTTHNGYHWGPVWSPDDEWVAYTTDRSKPHQTLRRLSSGLGGEELLRESQDKAQATDWSADGRFLLYEVLSSETDWDIALYDLESRELKPLVQTPWVDETPSFSPDGEWVLYASSETGRWEIYVVPTSRAGRKYQVSTTGGRFPHWAAAGDEIYYIDLEGRLMTVALERGGDLHFELPSELFALARPFQDETTFQGMPDGERFLVMRDADAGERMPLTLVQNWSRLLKHD